MAIYQETAWVTAPFFIAALHRRTGLDGIAPSFLEHCSANLGGGMPLNLILPDGTRSCSRFSCFQRIRVNQTFPSDRKAPYPIVFIQFQSQERLAFFWNWSAADAMQTTKKAA